MNQSVRYIDMQQFKAPLLWGAVGIGVLFLCEYVAAHFALTAAMKIACVVIQLIPMAMCLLSFTTAVLRQDELKRRIMSEAIVLGCVATVFVALIFGATQRMQVWSPAWSDIGALLPILSYVAFQYTKRKYA